MPVHKLLNPAVALLVLALGNSFPAMAQSHEKDPQGCEPALTVSSAPLKFELAVKIPSQGATAMAWTQAENSLWLIAVDKNYGTVRLFEPLKSPVVVFKWQDIKLSQDHSPRWTSSADHPFQLWLGDQAMSFDFLQPSRVRIMPVGGFKGDDSISKVVDDKGDEVSVFVNSDYELNAVYSDSSRASLKIQLPAGETRTPQILRGKNGSILILLERSPYTHSSIFALAKGALSPVAVVRASFLFAGLNGEEMVAWSEAGASADQFSVKLARLESLTSPVFSFPLEPAEIVKSYTALPGDQLHGFLAVLTNQRILLLKYSSH